MAESSSRVVKVNGRNRRPWALQSREKLLKAATDEIARVGFDKARLTDIARLADMTAGSVYTWFENKEDLFRAALEDALESQLLGNLHAMSAIQNHYGEKWMVEIGSLLPRNYEDTGTTNAQKLLIESYYAAWRDEDAREKLLPRLRLHMQMYVDIIERAQAKGDIDKSHNARALAMVLMTIPMGQSLMGLAGIERIEDGEWMPLILGMSAALKPKN
jgi:AcrR family transcriptional regulator